jgi:ABC-type enterochelin transport system permease subunit
MNKIVTIAKSIFAALLLYVSVSAINYAIIETLYAGGVIQQGEYNHFTVSRFIFVLLILLLTYLINNKSHREISVLVVLGLLFGSMLIPVTSFFVLIYLFYLFLDKPVIGKKSQ